jgi:cytochrome P450
VSRDDPLLKAGNTYNILSTDGKIIPANTNFVVATFFMGRDPTVFANAEEFIPERFDATTSADKQNPYSYIPFSAGPRNCIGKPPNKHHS